MVLDNKFELGQTVYVKTDPSQLPRMVISIELLGNGNLIYKVTHLDYVTSHYDFELSCEEDTLLKQQSY